MDWLDVAGTFTDVAAFDEVTGRRWVRKVPTTPADRSVAVLSCVVERCMDGLLHYSEHRVREGVKAIDGETRRRTLLRTRSPGCPSIADGGARRMLTEVAWF
jgi:hypothetical protein